MPQEITLNVNGKFHQLEVEFETPLLFVLRNDLGLKGVKYGCGSEQCGACKVLLDGQAVPTCKLPVKNAAGMPITTIEGLGAPSQLHPLQEGFIELQATQCGYCTGGMIISAQGLLNQHRYPTDEQIQAGLDSNLCRCGVYERVRRAIKLRIGRPDPAPLYEVRSEMDTQLKPEVDVLPSALIENPHLDSWVRINQDKTITLFTGKVEYGQGIKTAVAQIGAEELDISLDRIRVAVTDTDHSPNEGLTVGSMSLETTGQAIRLAAAQARQVLLSIAFEELEAPINQLVVDDGTITDAISGRQTTYWDLFAGQRFGRKFTKSIKLKSPAAYTILGVPARRLDLVEKVSGTFPYIHDLELPGMVHGRVLRPPNYAARLVSFDEQAISQVPGVLKVVRDGSFLAVICEREGQALHALELMRESATWQGELDVPAEEEIHDDLLNQDAQSYLVVDGTPVTDPIPEIKTPAGAAHTLAATYYRPYQMHASLGPSAALAKLVDGELTLWVQSQGIYPIRAAVAAVLDMDEAKIRVIHTEGAGCYGHNGADDAALDAALLALSIPGRPVSVKWSREDEHAWEPYGPATLIQLQASLNEHGEVIDWNHDVWGYPHLGRARSFGDTSGLLAAWHLAEPLSKPELNPVLAPHVGSHRNADPLYAFPKRRVVKHHVKDSPLRVSALRGLGAYASVFAIESFMDELAHAAGIDPLKFRLNHLQDERARAVLEAAAGKSGWMQEDKDTTNGHGHGIAFAQYKNRQCYAAVAVQLQVDRETGEINLEKAVIAADAGQIVNPDGLSNQLEGSFIQAASWTLYEQVKFDQGGITSRDWDSYPVLKFSNAPKIETVLLNRPGYPFLGSGEAAQGPTPAAIANAVFDALGIRLRSIPFTLERVRAALIEK
jgi:CO/xanthine dehydrogenase Mo-binding subunit/aerobic-type carbon monoxide dehydrogenase small subunit (CoxS/CutS family)